MMNKFMSIQQQLMRNGGKIKRQDLESWKLEKSSHALMKIHLSLIVGGNKN